VPKAQDYYPQCPEALIVNLAREGDRSAFEELVRRRQSMIRNLMRRCCRDTTLADDLAQQVFLQVWQNIRSLRKANAFGGWLRKLAISVWLKHLRKNDALRQAKEAGTTLVEVTPTIGLGLDLDHALDSLSEYERLTVVLAYQLGMTHSEIAEQIDLPLGTVKSHIKRGSDKLKQILSYYNPASVKGNST
jgi:RNA polymerase sigma-70 factor (ECF subfamily)